MDSLSDDALLEYIESPEAHPAVGRSKHERTRALRARRTNLSEEASSAAVVHPAVVEERREVSVRRPAAPVPEGTAMDYVATVFAERGVDNVTLVSTVAMRNGGTLWRMRGTCPIHGVIHHSNHWVLMNSPGYNTTRVQCMHDGSIREMHRLPID